MRDWSVSSYSMNGQSCIEWRVSSYSVTGQNCVEWRSACNTEINCVEVLGSDLTVLVRDTKDRRRAALAFSPAAWTAFVQEVGS